MADVSKDPVCGMEISEHNNCTSYQGNQYCFCSNECRERFESEPERYSGESSYGISGTSFTGGTMQTGGPGSGRRKGTLDEGGEGCCRIDAGGPGSGRKKGTRKKTTRKQGGPGSGRRKGTLAGDSTIDQSGPGSSEDPTDIGPAGGGRPSHDTGGEGTTNPPDRPAGGDLGGEGTMQSGGGGGCCR